MNSGNQSLTHMVSKQTAFTLGVILILLLVMGFITLSIYKKNQQQQSDVSQILGNDKTESYASLSGEDVSLEKFEGTVRVVNSWASWSPLSKTELQNLNKIAEKYANQNVNVIAINRNEDRFRAEKFLDKLGELNNINFLLDGDDDFYARMDGKAMPETLFFDRKGNVIMHARGDLSYSEMETHVQAALDSK